MKPQAHQSQRTMHVGCKKTKDKYRTKYARLNPRRFRQVDIGRQDRHVLQGKPGSSATAEVPPTHRTVATGRKTSQSQAQQARRSTLIPCTASSQRRGEREEEGPWALSRLPLCVRERGRRPILVVRAVFDSSFGCVPGVELGGLDRLCESSFIRQKR